MASGWAPDGAVQDQIDDSITDAVRLARSRLPSGPGEIHCQECGEEIPEARRRAMPGARLCVPCQSGHDRSGALSAYNRRGSKDSQLR
ncbi:zinc finger domain-containing protein YbiI [Hyphomicrobiales bacterium]|nr:zinc finger domain-containing protein YbiI [Hyphomicrobiales bacterium]CAH1700439.1 zinc finger domain-containing protein YbiI [Hyphomicrobiales bacterium]CAI0344321.1 zinc finger domain-containing protein YbiI [Hyphomicrobiales bacterium]